FPAVNVPILHHFLHTVLEQLLFHRLSLLHSQTFYGVLLLLLPQFVPRSARPSAVPRYGSPASSAANSIHWLPADKSLHWPGNSPFPVPADWSAPWVPTLRLRR